MSGWMCNVDNSTVGVTLTGPGVQDQERTPFHSLSVPFINSRAFRCISTQGMHGGLRRIGAVTWWGVMADGEKRLEGFNWRNALLMMWSPGLIKHLCTIFDWQRERLFVTLGQHNFLSGGYFTKIFSSFQLFNFWTLFLCRLSGVIKIAYRLDSWTLHM